MKLSNERIKTFARKVTTKYRAMGEEDRLGVWGGGFIVLAVLGVILGLFLMGCPGGGPEVAQATVRITNASIADFSLYFQDGPTAHTYDVPHGMDTYISVPVGSYYVICRTNGLDVTGYYFEDWHTLYSGDVWDMGIIDGNNIEWR